ncbi:hypothetical protein L596_005836 [Steinernema carpocapsae]|uniref:Uncharacterized protein n=1 Tax=Steinernema carpocapsae TaxID=34508 RepID=A0A4U8V696_STECR|nr:hypothetical protein L596_005836 [Steinernema carpocapsae]
MTTGAPGGLVTVRGKQRMCLVKAETVASGADRDVFLLSPVVAFPPRAFSTIFLLVRRTCDLITCLRRRCPRTRRASDVVGF